MTLTILKTTWVVTQRIAVATTHFFYSILYMSSWFKILRIKKKKKNLGEIFVEAIILYLTFYINYSWYICRFITSSAPSMKLLIMIKWSSYARVWRFFFFFVRKWCISRWSLCEFIYINHQDFFPFITYSWLLVIMAYIRAKKKRDDKRFIL